MTPAVSTDPSPTNLAQGTQMPALSAALSVLPLEPCAQQLLMETYLGSSTKRRIADDTWATTDIVGATGELVDSGLVANGSLGTEPLSQVDFAAAVGSAIEKAYHQCESAEADERLAIFGSIWRRVDGEPRRLGLRLPIEEEFRALVAASRRVVNAFPDVPSPKIVGDDEELERAYEGTAPASCLHLDVLSSRRAAHPSERRYFQSVAALDNCTVTVAPSIPLRLALIDDRRAIVPMDPHAYWAGAYVIEDEAAVAQVAAHLLAAVARAVPLQRQPTVVLDDRQTEVMRLMSSGLTDAAIARRLSVTDRTVRRIVAEVMDVLAVDSRFALAVACARLALV